MHSDTRAILQDYTRESLATQEISTVSSAKLKLSGEPLQCLSTQDGTFTNADIPDIYKLRGISDSVPTAAPSMPWFPFDQTGSFGPSSGVFGIKSEKVENEIYSAVKMEPKVESGDSSRLWMSMEQKFSSDGSDRGIDMRPLQGIASVTPTQLPMSAAELPCDTRRNISTPVSHITPPVSASHVSSFPFGSGGRFEDRGHILPGIAREDPQSSVCGEDVSESDPEADDGHCSPPPQRINQEAHRSTNAV